MCADLCMCLSCVGIVPVTCEKLFEGIRKKEGDGDEFQVALSMLEIYNEQTRDLLNIGSAQKGGLKVRESQSKGFYGENLRTSTYAYVMGVFVWRLELDTSIPLTSYKVTLHNLLLR